MLAIFAANVAFAAPVEAPEYAEFDGVVTLMRRVDRYCFAQANDGRFWRIDMEGHPAQRFATGDLVRVKGLQEKRPNRHTTRLFAADVTKTGHDKSQLPTPKLWTIAELNRHP